MMKPYHCAAAAVLVLALAAGALAQSAAQTPRPKAPANVGNVPQKPGPATRTARGPAPRQPAQPWKQIPIPPLPAFKAVAPKRITLPNGMVVFLQEDHELPLIAATARIRGGSLLEPATKIGLVDIYGEVWRTGGTKSKTGDQMDDFLEARAAKIETNSGNDSTSVSLDCLKANFDEVFALFLELLREPAFREDKIGLAKQQMNTMIARRNDDQGAIASREARQLAYGEHNPYARVPEYSTVAAVKRDDLVKWHEQFVHPNNILFGVVGDFDPAQMEARIRQAFESWPKGPDAPKPEIQFTPARPGLYYANKEDVNQSAIRMVALGIQRNNPDYFAVEVMNEILGGGFSGRLMQNIRTKQGLAYTVGGALGAAYDHPGVFSLGMGTKTASTAVGIKALKQQLEELRKNPGTPEELKRAKDAILNAFIFSIDTPEKVLEQRMTYEWYGYPLDFLEKYFAGVEKVTLADVARVVQKYVHPDAFSVLVVGNNEAEELASSLGPVAKLDISIPPPEGTAATQKTVQSNPEGKALMAKVVQGLGGEAVLQSVNSLRQKLSMVRKTPQGEIPLEMENTIVFPDKVVQQITTPMGPVSSVMTPNGAFMTMGGQVRELTAPAREEAANELKREMLVVAKHVNDPKYTFAAGGTEKIGEVEARVLDINANGGQTRWYVDPQSGRVLRVEFTAIGQGGPSQRVIEHSEFRTFQGLTVPTQATISENGQPVGTVTVQNVEVNPPVNPKLFEKPAAAKAAAPQSR
ncbi:MAG: insulinase family protein [Terriglobales bacterium]